MTLLASGARRRTTYALPLSAAAAPWNSSETPCTIPTYDGSGATIHPSVVDMGGPWNGYRWWMANTPYPGGNDDYENPCIYGSNDRRTWVVPAGLTNPLDPNPGNPWFHSDTELMWNPDTGKMIVFYRLASSATTPATIYLRAQSSPDGVTWTDHGTLFQFAGDGARLSPAVWRIGSGDWRMWTWGGTVAGHHWSATDPLGTWTDEGEITLNGGAFTGWHGDVIWYGDKWIAAYSTTSTSGIIKTASSADGIAWTDGGTIMEPSTGTGWDDNIYRPTLLPSTLAGFVDCWYSAFGSSVTGGCGTDYVRLPDALWPAT